MDINWFVWRKILRRPKDQWCYGQLESRIASRHASCLPGMCFWDRNLSSFYQCTCLNTCTVPYLSGGCDFFHRCISDADIWQFEGRRWGHDIAYLLRLYRHILPEKKIVWKLRLYLFKILFLLTLNLWCWCPLLRLDIYRKYIIILCIHCPCSS